MDYTLQDLEREAQAKKAALNAKLRARYQLAKQLGFSPTEAQILSLKAEGTIQRLANQAAKDNQPS